MIDPRRPVRSAQWRRARGRGEGEPWLAGRNAYGGRRTRRPGPLRRERREKRRRAPGGGTPPGPELFGGAGSILARLRAYRFPGCLRAATNSRHLRKCRDRRVLSKSGDNEGNVTQGLISWISVPGDCSLWKESSWPFAAKRPESTHGCISVGGPCLSICGESMHPTEFLLSRERICSTIEACNGITSRVHAVYSASRHGWDSHVRW